MPPDITLSAVGSIRNTAANSHANSPSERGRNKVRDGDTDVNNDANENDHLINILRVALRCGMSDTFSSTSICTRNPPGFSPLMHQ